MKLEQYANVNKRAKHSILNCSQSSRFCWESVVVDKQLRIFSHWNARFIFKTTCANISVPNFPRKKSQTTKSFESIYLFEGSYLDCVHNTIVFSIRLTFDLVHWASTTVCCWYISLLHNRRRLIKKQLRSFDDDV